MERPSPKEIDKKLREAKQALRNGRAAFANFEKVVNELMVLNIGDSEELWVLIGELIEEISQEDYAGGRPPQKSYEPKIKNSDLWAFHWISSKFKKEMYLKFSVKEGFFYYVSLHESAFKKLKKNKQQKVTIP